MSITTVTPQERDDNGVTAGILRQLAEAVEQMKNTPAIRLKSYHRYEFQQNVDSPEQVDAMAAGLGVTAQWNRQHTHYEAVKEYGPNVAYLVIYITPEHMVAYTKHWASFPAEAGNAAEAGAEPELAVA